MSLSGSTSESYAKTGDAALRVNDAQGPDPTPENPGGVFPQASGGSAQPGTMPGSGAPETGGDVRSIFGNPEVFKDTIGKLSTTITETIHAIDQESASGLGTKAKALKKRLEEIQAEVDGWRIGKGLDVGEEQNDEVERPSGDAGGLYKD